MRIPTKILATALLPLVMLLMLSPCTLADVSVSAVKKADIGNGQLIVADVTFDSTYAFGGEELTASTLGFRVGSELRAVSILRSEHGISTIETECVAYAWVPNSSDGSKGNLRAFTFKQQDTILTSPRLGIGTSNAAQVRNSAAYTYVVGGSIAEDAASETAFTATTHDITADASTAQEAWYTLTVASGTITITKGTTADTGSATPADPVANEAVVGFIKIVVAAGATDFDATTDELGESHLTVTYYDYDDEVLQGTDLSGTTVRVMAFGR